MYGGVRGGTNFALVLGLGILIAATPANAADLGGDCCADLEERISDLEATAARKGNRKVSLTVGGSVNEALLFWDDGFESNVYQGTNYAARSRFRFVGDARINKEWSAGYLLEIGVTTNRLNRTDQNTPHGVTNIVGGTQDAGILDTRFSTWWIQSTELGRLWVGKGDQATERITEINLANTNNFLKHYGRWNGSFRLRLGDGTLATTTWGNILPQYGVTGEGVPGEGDRWNVVKYDSPEFGGFVFSAAWGEDDLWDTALRYAAEHHGFKVAAGIGYAEYSGTGSLNERGCTIIGGTGAGADLYSAQSVGAGKGDCSSLGLSGSIIHVESGLFFTGAYGIKWDDYRNQAFALAATAAGSTPGRVHDEDSFYSLQAGIERKLGHLGTLGKSTIYANYEHYDTGAITAGNGLTATSRPRNLGGTSGALFANPVPGPGGVFFGSGADIDVWGAGFNQNIEAASIDLYVAWQRAEAEVSGSRNGAAGGPGARTINIEPIDMVMSGAVVKF
jgi:hypothetical protein